jgi:diguanylate cyclase (GGDEF)-like protein
MRWLAPEAGPPEDGLDEVGPRVVAALYLVGAALGAVSLLLPHPSAGEAEIWAIVAFASLAGVGLLLAAGRVPRRGVHAAVAVASLLINLGILASGTAAGIYSLMFFWLVIFSSYYFTPGAAVAQVAWILACYALVLSVVDPAAGYSMLTRWIVTAMALVVGGTMTSWLAITRGELASEARADPLTGIPNRRWLHAELEREIARAERQEFALCAAFIDLDYFKDFNDAHGHAGGDALLCEATEAWRRVLRPSDFLARYGGDEFVVLLPDTEVVMAEMVIERLRRSTPEGQSSSAGVAEWVRGESADDLLKRADRRLYEAKASGRARVVAEVVPAGV